MSTSRPPSVMILKMLSVQLKASIADAGSLMSSTNLLIESPRPSFAATIASIERTVLKTNKKRKVLATLAFLKNIPPKVKVRAHPHHPRNKMAGMLTETSLTRQGQKKSSTSATARMQQSTKSHLPNQRPNRLYHLT